MMTQELTSRSWTRASFATTNIAAKSGNTTTRRSKEFGGETMYAPESDEFSAITSMSQSSFSQPQSQNLLGSQDGQLHRVQQWQAERVPPAPKSPARCNGEEKLLKLEQALTKAFVEQTREQKHQQQRLLEQLTNPIKKSLEDAHAKLASSCESQQQQKVAAKELEKGICAMTESITALRQKVFELLARSLWLELTMPFSNVQSKSACAKIRTAVVDETAAVKAALTELHARIETVEGSVRSYSDLVTQVLKVEATKHDTLLSAVAASSCTCPKELTSPTIHSRGADTTDRKRRRSSCFYEMADINPGSFTPPAARPPPRTKTYSSPRFDIGTRPCYGSENDESRDEELHFALRRIETLRAKRRQHQHDL
ncbi:uncharacterized protein PITG_19879 [Phytophthora infestans T30-4]|uniref:Uncharacterized protein n=1 Tax=Phytophthora infestans (strain T30-4) TaxID=403677 RepID=D0P0P3_PHYIT|nr:uncharacterized protein PITG_19879 [Phytophthora infestans T30-4]EEY53010.1 conserved hypothetical protein [Phytophthora infestans T30-4]|eukprot:XP_002896138.1 conserved hypothetical protein [Phytophthora infestans T30-4]